MRKSQYLRIVKRKTFHKAITKQDRIHLLRKSLQLTIQGYIYVAKMQFAECKLVEATLSVSLLSILIQRLAQIKEC